VPYQEKISTLMAKQEDAGKSVRLSEYFTPINALSGGLAIGTVAASRLFLWGKITGISGMLSGIINKPTPGDWTSRAAFAGGMLLSGAAMEVSVIIKIFIDEEIHAGVIRPRNSKQQNR
jgi:hypothetical protein